MKEMITETSSELSGSSDSEREDASFRKSESELRIERFTWFGLVSVLILSGIVGDWIPLHSAWVPACSGLVLLASAIHQWRKQWRVGYTTWLAGALMLGLAVYSVLERPDLDLSLIVIVIVAIVVGAGALGGET